MKRKLAMLSWVTPRFCGKSFLQALPLLEQSKNWLHLKKQILQSGFAVKPTHFEQLEHQYPNWVASRLPEVRWTFPTQCDFPHQILGSYMPPAMLSYQGEPLWLQRRGVAIVGSRKIHPLSRVWLQQHLSNFVQQHQGYVASGGAVGVDQEVHRVVVLQNKPTVVVVPSGLSRLYPSSLPDLVPAVLKNGGTILSPFAPDKKVRPSLFHYRNRLLVTLCDQTIVVQAARRSGSHMSALIALEEGREVGVVPGHPCESQMQGNLDLLVDGAQLVRHQQDLSFMTFESDKHRQ